MKRNVIIAVAAAAAVVGGGSLTGMALSTDGDRTEQISAPGGVGAQQGGADGGGTDDGGATVPELVVDTALAEVPGIVTEVDHDGQDDDGRAGWEIGIAGDDGQWHRVWVAEDGGSVLDARVAGGDDTDAEEGDDPDDTDADGDEAGEALNDEARALLTADGITADEAIQLAQAHTSATLTEAGLDDDGSHWELELRGDDGTEHEVNVEVASGEISTGDQDGDDGRDDADDGTDTTDDNGDNGDDGDDEQDARDDGDQD